MYIDTVVYRPTYPIVIYSRFRCTVWCHIEARIAAQARLAADKQISYGLSYISPSVKIFTTEVSG